MSVSKRKADAGESSPADRQPIEFPRLGDTVLYAHRSGGGFALIPMIITKVYHGSTTVDGVAFSGDHHLMFNAAASKPLKEVRQGKSEGTWQPRP